MVEPHKTNLVDGKTLNGFITRLERIGEEKRGLSEDFSDEMKAAKSQGFDPKIIRKIISIRKQDKAKRTEEEEILSCYLLALGME
jgi:uncharacterized protein (UPF0335 family)